MIDEKQRALIHAGVDGELDGNEQSELETLLGESAEARKLHDDLRAMDELLGSIPDAQPPEGLRQSLLNLIPSSPASSTTQAASTATDSNAKLQVQWFPLASRYALARYAIAFVAGFLVTLVGYELVTHQSADNETSDLVGSMVSSMIVTGDVPATATRTTDSIALERLNGELTLHRSNGFYVLEFDLESMAAVELTMDLDKDHLVFDGFAQLESDLKSVQVVHGVLRVTHEGKNRFAVLLRPDTTVSDETAGQVAISFYTGGRQVHESVLDMPR